MTSSASPAMSLARLSIERPVYTWLIILTCLLGGLSGFFGVGRLEDPAFTIKEAIVFAPYPGASAEEVESEVTELLEIAIQQMAEVDRITSESSPGLAEIHVTVDDTLDGHELPEVWTKLRARVRDAVSDLPPGAAPPVVYDDFGDTYGLFYAVTADGYSDEQIRDIARDLRRELLVVEGVAKVAVDGEPEERIFIEISQDELSRFNLSYQQLLSAVNRENAVIIAGSIERAGRYMRFEVPQTLDGIEPIENTLITLGNDGDTLRLSDIATVSRAPAERPQNFIYHNNQRAFTIGVAGQTTANIVDVGHAVDARLAELSAELPLGIELEPIYQQHVVVDNAINDFLISLAMSVGIVIGVLCIFMGWRAGLTVGSVLLLTVMGTFFFMNMFALEMERISLGALIIAMGMLVDNAIVVTEGMLTGVQRGKRRLDAAVDAVQSTQWPLLGATVIGIMAFSGIGLSPDATGEFLFSLFAVIGISLLLSWVLAVTVVPMIGFYLFEAERKKAMERDDHSDMEADLYSRGMLGRYAGLLSLALHHRWAVLGGLLIVTLACYVGFGSVRNSFFPNTNTPMFFVDLQYPEGTDILTVNEAAQAVGEFVGEQDETVSFDTFVGAGATRFMLTYTAEQPSASYAQIIVQTASLDVIPDLADRILEHVGSAHPDAEIRATRIVFGPPAGAKLAARFSGPDANVLRQLSEEAMERLYSDADVQDIRTDWRNRTSVIVPEMIESRARATGVTREDIGAALAYAADGSQVGLYRDNEDLIPIIARAPAGERGSSHQLGDLLVWSNAQQAYVPISQVVSRFTIQSEDALIQRRDRVRTITVLANPHDGETAMEGFVRFAPVIESIDLPPGYTMEWGGEYESSADANEALGGQLPATFIIMIVISFLLFAKVRQPLVIWSIVPMSLNGVAIGLLATGVPFSFTALLGLLSLSGMLIKNAIVLVDEIDLRIRRGDDPFQAVQFGSASRLRPVLLAASTTILGMAPLFWDAFFQAMAVTIVGGLAFASILTMIAVPVIYALFLGIRPAGQSKAEPTQEDAAA
ncbi:efflux RND transporter permease subunit [Maricaulis sp. D1M11]|uniref:efflux RND transporter permease subunit n=1 Tax=Maricaulis sp. D1M11 TaxID=3076117 RepID=UPI0039B55DD5